MNGDDPQKADNTEATEAWKFQPDNPDSAALEAAQQAEVPAPAQEANVAWTASEFIAHEKGVDWYLALAVATGILTGLVFLLTRDKISSAVVIVAAVVFGVYAARKPRTLEYRLSETGLFIANKFYDYGQFRSFSIIHDGATSSINFMPLKRLMPTLTIYYSPEDEEKIVQLLSDRLPLENRGRDPVDRFLHRIRF